MGLNLPMLLTNSQTLDSWSSAGQYSPPTSADRTLTITSSAATSVASNSMCVQIPTITAFPNSTSNPHELSIGTRSLFGGSSNNSEPTVSPHKAMDMTDLDENKNEHAGKEERLQGSPSLQASMASNSSIRGGGGTESDAVCTSPLANVNTNEAHLHTQHPALRQLPHHAHPTHTTHPPHTHTLSGSRVLRDTEDLEIKQELVDYFHGAPTSLHPGADSQRSYSSTDELRTSVDEYAQDLRVAAAKGLEFGNFVLPHNLRPPRSSPTESLEEKYTPLNMRKLNVANNSTVAAAAAAAGNVLMNSLLSNEGMSEENTNNSARLKRSTSQDAASAAAIYAESFTNRDDCDFVGSNVTLKLRAMDRTQRIIAEKLISEVLFYGQFNELERNARIQPK